MTYAQPNLDVVLASLGPLGNLGIPYFSSSVSFLIIIYYVFSLYASRHLSRKCLSVYAQAVRSKNWTVRCLDTNETYSGVFLIFLQCLNRLRTYVQKRALHLHGSCLARRLKLICHLVHLTWTSSGFDDSFRYQTFVKLMATYLQ